MQVSLSILAAFGATFFWGIGDFLIQRETRKVGDMESLAFIGTLGAIGLFPFVIPELPLLFTEGNLALLAFAGIITFVTSVLDFEALKQGKLSVVEVILEIELPITAVLGYVFLRESLSFAQMGTIVLIFAGIVLISVDSLSLQRNAGKFEKGAILAVLTAAGMATMNFLTAVGSKQISPLMIIWLPWLLVGMASLLIISRREGFGKLLRNGSRFKTLILWTAAIDTVAWLLYATALSENELAVTTAITESYPAVCIFLGVWLNRERILPHQYAGAFLALFASISLAFMV